MQSKLTNTLVNALEPADKPYEIPDGELKGLLVRVQPTGRKTYYLSYRCSLGKRNRICLGKSGKLTARQARDLAKQHLADIARGVDVQGRKKESRAKGNALKNSTLGHLLDTSYKEYCLTQMKRGDRRLSTINQHFGQWRDKPLSEITTLMATRWRADRITEGFSPGGVNRPLSALKALFNRAVEWGVIDTNPIAMVKPLREDTQAVVRHLSTQEETTLRGTLAARQDEIRSKPNLYKRQKVHIDGQFTDHLMPIVLLALNTGMRKDEIFSLEWQDVHLEQPGFITIHGHKAKSSQTRHIPLNAEARDTLLSWQQQNQPGSTLVFSSPFTGTKLQTIQSPWKKVLKAAGIPDFRFHDLRHTFASKLVMAGADLNTVRELLGHSDLKLTLRYAHLAPEHKAAAVALLNPATSK